MKHKSPFVISEFTNPSGAIVFQLYARLDGKRFRKNFPTRAEAEAERQVHDAQWLQRETGIRAAATRLTDEQLHEAESMSTTADRHTHVEWLAFLKKVHRKTPPELALHLIVDNYATHKHPTVIAWLEKHPRVHVHFTPTSSSWLNMVERFFRNLTEDVVRDGSFGSVGELTTAINVYLANHNLAPKPFRWKAKGVAILEKIRRARAAQSASNE
jgi:hypothetical protein